MKRIQPLLCLIFLTVASPSRAYRVQRLSNIDDYMRLGKTIIIAQCVPNEEDPIYSNVCTRKVRVIEVLKGDLKKDQEIRVNVGRPLLSTYLYLIFSGGQLDEKGELDAYTYEPATVQITLWGEISKTEKQGRIARFLKDLEPLTLQKKLTHILMERSRDLIREQRGIEGEQKSLDALLSN